MINSEYEMKKIDKVLTLEYGVSLPENKRISGDFPVYGSNGVVGNHNEFLIKAPCIIVGRKGSAGEVSWSDKNCTPIDTTFYVKLLDEAAMDLKFTYHMLKSLNLPSLKVGSGPGGINRKNIYGLQIPVPPLDVQQQIVNKCKAVDQDTDQAHQTITKTRQEIEALVNSIEKTSRLNQVVDKISDIVNPQEEDGIVCYIGLENIESQTGVLLEDTQSDYSTIRSNKNAFRRGDILYGKLRPNLNKVVLANIDGICSTDILVLRPNNPNLATFYKHYFLSEAFNSEVLTTVSGQQLPRTSWEKIERILVPSLDIPQGLVTEVEQLEAKITEAQAIIDNATERINSILAKFL